MNDNLNPYEVVRTRYESNVDSFILSELFQPTLEVNDELIEDIVISEDGNLKVIFKYEDKYFEALDFINKQKCDIMLTS